MVNTFIEIELTNQRGFGYGGVFNLKFLKEAIHDSRTGLYPVFSFERANAEK
jgi:hypothetical protein